MTGSNASDLVAAYLRAQNLEAIGRIDEAIESYERGVESGFDSAGPYDRLIAIYQGRSDRSNLIRVAQSALTHVRTFPAKRDWYETKLREAEALPQDSGGAEF